ncbi:hemolysin III family protein [Acidaminobacter sp. JC074]|uniref:PAQR family membrane homeostasis protein TrhA n=1 Tax=Acidaminobacter sp. JC074 TaxID=2530199 RepID=UPI001F0EC939|nr:hemolysin III family protein [Acidaminobacter sp. JC074]MCH4887258.1 hemolysin III family protein [Acidaminobacter sp. JC074]
MTSIREPINSITHFIGMVTYIIALPFVLIKSTGWLQMVAMTIFLMGLIGLYGTSSIYHALQKAPETLKKWRKADHIMIYILIAATYTPICLIALKGLVGYILLAVIWTLSIAGIVFKILWLNMPRKIYTALYVILGWAAIFAIYPLYQAVGPVGISLLVAGGVSYTVGAVFYAKKSKFHLGPFGFHEIFHLFILLGSALHFLMVYYFVL